MNVTIQSLMRVTPLRNFFLIPENYQHSKSPLVHRFGELTRKIWHARNFKGQVSLLNQFAACFVLSLYISDGASRGACRGHDPSHDPVFSTKTFELRRTLLHVLVFSPNNFASPPNLAIQLHRFTSTHISEQIT